MTILSSRDFTYHFQVAVLVSTGLCLWDFGEGRGWGRGAGAELRGRTWGGVRTCQGVVCLPSLQLPNPLIQSLHPPTQGQANCSAEAPVQLATDYYFRFYRLCH